MPKLDTLCRPLLEPDWSGSGFWTVFVKGGTTPWLDSVVLVDSDDPRVLAHRGTWGRIRPGPGPGRFRFLDDELKARLLALGERS